MRPFVLGALGALAAFGTVEAQDARDLAPDFRKACRTAPSGALPAGLVGDYGVIKAEAVGKALFTHYPVETTGILKLPASAPGEPDTPAMRLAASAIAQPLDAKDDGASLYAIARMVDEWSRWPQPANVFLSLEAGGLRIVQTGAAPLGRKQLLAQIFEGDDKDILIICRDPQSEPPPPLPAPSPGAKPPNQKPDWVLVKTADDLGETDITKKTFAEFAYSDDRQKHVQAWGVQFALGWRWAEQPVELAPPTEIPLRVFKWTPAVFVAYERKGENDPDTDGYANNLNFGGQIDGRYSFNVGPKTWAAFYSVTGLFETDDDFKSSAYGAELKLDPPLPVGIPGHRHLTRIGNPNTPDSERRMELDWRWDVDLVADWTHVGDAGGKQLLLDRAEYARLGYDAGFRVRFGPAQKEWRLLLAADYQVRDGQTHEGGDAQLVTASLKFLDSDEAPYAFGVSYERGENLQSFETSEIWKLTFGYRH